MPMLRGTNAKGYQSGGSKVGVVMLRSTNANAKGY